MTTYTSTRWGAITLGVLCAAGAGLVLLEDAARAPSIDHLLAVVALIVTIAAGHLAVRELRGFHLLRAAGLGILFAGGVMFTLVSTAGRTIEVQDRSSADIDARNGAIAAKKGELTRARTRFQQAEQMVEKEMTGETCGKRCQDWKTRAKEVRANIRQLETELSGLGGEQQANAKLRGFARLLAVAGGDEAAITAKLTTAWPYVLPLLLELGSIVFWSIGLGGRPASPRAITERETPFTPDEIEDLKRFVKDSEPAPGPTPATPGGGRRKSSQAEQRRQQVSEFVTAYRARHGRDPSPRAVRDHTGLPRATAWRYQQAA